MAWKPATRLASAALPSRARDIRVASKKDPGIAVRRRSPAHATRLRCALLTAVTRCMSLFTSASPPMLTALARRMWEKWVLAAGPSPWSVLRRSLT